jgi:hypothetical protein
MTPPPSRRRGEEDHTDSDSAHSGEITEVRSWKGIDENGKPATFVEERRTVRPRMIEQGSERGGLGPEYGSLRGSDERASGRDRLVMRSWRDVWIRGGYLGKKRRRRDEEEAKKRERWVCKSWCLVLGVGSKARWRGWVLWCRCRLLRYLCYLLRCSNQIATSPK